MRLGLIQCKTILSDKRQWHSHYKTDDRTFSTVKMRVPYRQQNIEIVLNILSFDKQVIQLIETNNIKVIEQCRVILL